MHARHTARRWHADGLVLQARDYPPRSAAERTPVVCLHGLTRNAADFEQLAQRLAACGHRVIVPDIRGRGRSAHDPQPMRYLPATYAADVAGLLDALGIDERIAAKQARDFAAADAIRVQLRDMGVLIEDTPQGVRWKLARDGATPGPA